MLLDLIIILAIIGWALGCWKSRHVLVHFIEDLSFDFKAMKNGTLPNNINTMMMRAKHSRAMSLSESFLTLIGWLLWPIVAILTIIVLVIKALRK